RNRRSGNGRRLVSEGERSELRAGHARARQVLRGGPGRAARHGRGGASLQAGRRAGDLSPRRGGRAAMSSRAYVGVRIGGDLVTLLPEHPVGVGNDDTPDLAVAMVRCAGCGATTPAVAPVTYKFYDDDHYGRLELWYESRHAGACAACAGRFNIETSYTLTRYPGSSRAEFSLDQLEQAGRRAEGGSFAFAPIDDLVAAAPPKADAPPPVARSSAECHLYMALHPCPCGE